jgi:hypothetical protein
MFLESALGRWVKEDHAAAPVADTPRLHVNRLYPTMKGIDFGGDAFALSQGEGEAFQFRVIPYHMKLSAKQTNGQFMMMEGTLEPGEGIIVRYIHAVLRLI